MNHFVSLNPNVNFEEDASTKFFFLNKIFYFRVTQSKYSVWNGAVVDNTVPQYVKMEKIDCTNQEKVHRHFWKVAKL